MKLILHKMIVYTKNDKTLLGDIKMNKWRDILSQERKMEDCQKTPSIPKLIHESYAMLIKISLKSFCWEKEQNNSIPIIIDEQDKC